MNRIFHVVSSVVLVLSLSAIGCQSPPEAPSDLESLLGFLFQHMDDEDPAALAEGLENLHEWFQDDDQLQRAREGFLINNLPAESLEGLDDRQRSPSGLEGIAVAAKSPFCAKALAGLLTWQDFGQLLDNFDLYERTFTSDPTCFGPRECLAVEADSHTKSAWAGIVDMESRYSIQYRWVETSVGWMMLQRFWLKDPVNGDQFEVKMKANYYIGVIMADGGRSAQPVSPAFRNAANGVVGRSGVDIDAAQEALGKAGSLRIHANWFNVDTGVITLPKATIRSTLIRNQVNDSTRHDDWLEGHPMMVDCPAVDPMDGDSGGAGGAGGAGGMAQ